jgi:hypothetical protein
VVKAGFFPVAIGVAGLTFGALLAFMLVVFLVTTETVQRGVAKASQIFVTSIAFEQFVGVRIAQYKFGFVVIESGGGFPVALDMAILTGGPQIGFVFVIFFMATNAVLGGFLEQHAFVTGLALNLQVFAQQGKGAGLVVELGLFFPVALGVATATVFAQRLFVLVVLFVATHTVLRQLDLVDVAGVAGGACNGPVLAAQAVFGVSVMVEGGFLP